MRERRARWGGSAAVPVALALLVLPAAVPAAAPAALGAEEPWRLGAAAGAPAWLEIGGTYRLRAEALSSHLRPGREGSDELLASRLLLALRVGGDRLFGRVEVEDSRAFLDDADTPLGTDDVNAAEVLQAHLGLGRSGVLREGDRVELLAGRMTLDVGSRRLVARNRFRNTLNAFTGVHGAWRGGGGEPALQAFFLLPVDRRPTARDRLDDNDVENDREGSAVRLWGLHLADPALAGGLRGEAYVFGLREEDHPGFATADRRLVTAGMRLLRPPARGGWDFEVEGALQRGDSRRSASPADRRDLDHRAWFAHAHVGRGFDARFSPRLVLQADVATGDDDPLDGTNGRFDTLYGARRFELGPTGIFGLLARGNVRSPGVRLELVPGAGRTLIAAWRPAWLDSHRDVLTTNGVGAPDADSDFIGHLVEARFQTSPLPGNLAVELGLAHVLAGDLLDAAGIDDTTYGYAQTTYTF